MYILGINGGVRLGYQDISATLISNGEVIAAIEEERLNRVKYSPGQLPELSVQKVLDIANITIHDVDYIATHGETWGDVYTEKLTDYFKNTFGHCPKIERVHHHDAHAASAYYASGFDRAMVITYDSSGDGISTQFAIGDNGKLKVEERIERPNSLGMFYSLLTQFCGFRRDSDEYKLMGLSSYGNRQAFDFSDLLALDGSGYRFNTKFIKQVKPGEPQPTRQEMIFNDALAEMMGVKKRLRQQPVSQVYKDIAASAQQRLEEVIVHLVTEFHIKTGLRKLCLAGGVALNCVVNQKLMNMDFIDEIYVQPASGDSGISLGAAYWLSAQLGQQPKPMESAYLGPSFSNDEIEKTLKLLNVPYRHIDSPAAITAQKVTENKVTGWFQGRMEFGPRALGARSILANPASKDMQDIINMKIKFRESFRPFCPSVLIEDASGYFTGKQPIAPYMTITYDVKNDKAASVPAVTHFDNTARIQTVDEFQNPLFYQYLKELKNLTGIGMSVNTSFNRNNEPIVNTPAEAVSAFYGSGMDGLVMGNFFVEKR